MNVCSSIVSGLWGMRLGEGNGVGRPFKDKMQRTVSLIVRKPSPHVPLAVGHKGRGMKMRTRSESWRQEGCWVGEKENFSMMFLVCKVPYK